MPRDQFVSCLKSRKIISEGYIYHVVRLRDVDYENTFLDLVPVVSKFRE